MSVSYTNNWPHEPLVGNTSTTASLVWSIVSIVLLLVGIGGLAWYKAFKDREEEELAPSPVDPLNSVTITPSMKAVAKYAVTVIALFVLQVGFGALLAHYTVEGDSFYGIPIADFVPYSVARTWHLQLAVFWIATAFLAAGLFLAPAIGGKEPRFQRFFVNLLFGGRCGFHGW